MIAITHIVLDGTIFKLTDGMVDLLFVELVGHLGLNDLAAFGSASLADNDTDDDDA